MLVFEDPELCSGCLNSVKERLAMLLAINTSLDVWPIRTTDPLLETIRRVGCKIVGRTPSGEAFTENPWSLWKRIRRRMSN